MSISTAALAAAHDYRRAQRGFTLIELMIVVAIIAVLASILIPNFLNARAQAQTSACMANLNQIATAAELYYSDHNFYPANGAVTQGGIFKDAATNVDYMANTPRDPAALNTDVYGFTNQGQNKGFSVTCPPTTVHVNASMVKLQGWSATTTRMVYNSGSGIFSF